MNETTNMRPKKTRNKPSPTTTEAENFITESLRTYEELRRDSRPNKELSSYQFNKAEDFYYKCESSNPIDCPSKSTFHSAVTNLKKGGLIEKNDEGFYELVKRLKDYTSLFPILEIASGINVYPLRQNDVQFFRVYPNMSAEVANYLNHEFKCSDIYTVPLGDIIMCIDIGIPKGSELVKKKGGTLESRVLRKLRKSNFNINEYNDSHLNGYTEDELIEIEFNKLQQQQENTPKYGGVIKKRSNKLNQKSHNNDH
jgi:hypothetical protein